MAEVHLMGELCRKSLVKSELMCSGCMYFPKKAGGSNILYTQRESPDFLLYLGWEPHIYIIGEAACLIQMRVKSAHLVQSNFSSRGLTNCFSRVLFVCWLYEFILS